jgi:hypothetical protein
MQVVHYTVKVYDDNNCGINYFFDFNSGIHCFDDITVRVNRAITCDNLEDITAIAVDASEMLF